MFRTIAVALTLTVTGVARVVAQTAPAAPAWGVTIGAAAFAMPSYAGSKETRMLAFPMVNVTYRDRISLGPSASGVTYGVGYKMIRAANVVVAVNAGFQQDRPASRARTLAGMTDRAVATTAGMSVTYMRGALTGVLGAAQGMNDGAGFLGTARLDLTLPLSARMFASVGTGVTVADRRQMRREFGVTEAEAAERQLLVAGGNVDLPADAATAYAPAGGLRQVSASMSVVRILSAHWMAVGMGGVERLGEAAARSSLVERRLQVSGGVVLGYRF